MPLISSQEQLERITEIVRGLDAQLQPSTKKSRRLLRVPLRIQLKVTLLTGIAPSSVDVVTRNINSSGLGFVCRRMFRRDERIVVLLQIPKVPPKLVLARVIFARYISGGLYEMGAEFLECVADARLSPSGTPARIPKQWLWGAGNVKMNSTSTASDPAAAPSPAPEPAPAPAAAK